MTNVVSIGTTCEYLVSRAARHRRAGRYDEAMVLLTKARTQFGLNEEIELEKARIYDEIGCEEEAARSYFRVIRADGIHKAEALFCLAQANAQRGDVERAVSCFQMFTASDRQGVSDEMAMRLGKQLLEEVEHSASRSRKERIRMLGKKAAQLIQCGKITAAKRTVRHAIVLCPNAQNYTLMACCCLLKNETSEAVKYASAAHEIAPSRVQTLCVLTDALMMASDVRQAHRMIYIAAMRAKTPDDLLAAAIESAKYGLDSLTLRLTKKLLRRAPYHLRAMTLQACALSNMGRIRQASRVFGRIAGLLPEHSVASYYYRLTKAGLQPKERMGLGLDVPREEGVERAKTIISRLYSNSEQMDTDDGQLLETIMLCEWAMHSPLAGSHAKTVALIVLGALEVESSKEVLLDLLTDSQIAQSVKMAVLQMLTAKEGFKPYLVDIDGRLVSLAAGAVTERPVKHGEANSRCVQQAVDALAKEFPDAPQKMLNLYIGYIQMYGEPKRREENALAAALEYSYHAYAARAVKLRTIAKRYGISPRLCSIYIRRIKRTNSE